MLTFVTPAGFERFFAEGAARTMPPEDETVVVGPRLGGSSTTAPPVGLSSVAVIVRTQSDARNVAALATSS